MTDITWRDSYGSSEGLACTLDIWSNVLTKQGTYGAATDVSAAATALREQAERIAELEAENERLQADAIHTCHDNCQRTACVLRRRVAELETENAQLRADRDALISQARIEHRGNVELSTLMARLQSELQGAEQRVLLAFLAWCERELSGQNIMIIQNALLSYRQRAQAEGEG